MSPRYVGAIVFSGGNVQACDLCWMPIHAVEAYSVIELRVVCGACQARFQEERPSVNRTLGLMERGVYAPNGRLDPGDNGLGGRG